jgi:hypothetical protein
LEKGQQPAKYHQRPAEKSKASPEEIEAEVVTFKESSDKIEAMGSEAKTEATEAAVEWQELDEHLVVPCR